MCPLWKKRRKVATICDAFQISSCPQASAALRWFDLRKFMMVCKVRDIAVS